MLWVHMLWVLQRTVSEMVLLSTQNMQNLAVRKYLQFYADFFVYLNLWYRGANAINFS